VPFYALSQFTGAIAAAFTLRALLDPIDRIGTTTPSGSDVRALIMEIVVTFNMMFITSAVATDAKAVGELAGLAVGSSVCITSIVAGPVSGGSMNPARTLGPAIASREFKGLWVYFIGPVAGTLLGSYVYKVIQLSERKPIISPTFSLRLRRMMSTTTTDTPHLDNKRPSTSFLIVLSDSLMDDIIEPVSEQNSRSSYVFWKSLEQHYPPGFLKKVVAEIVATYLLVFVTCGTAALSMSEEHKVSKLGASVAGGLYSDRDDSMPEQYLHLSRWSFFYTQRKRFGNTLPSGTDIQALIMEIVVTFSMMFITSAVATDTKAIGELAGIAVGSAVCITSILAGPISGGSMNPARTIGPAIASSCYKGIWVYMVGPITGTLTGAWCYNLIRVSEKPVHALSQSSFSFQLPANDDQ
ncbi:hypothetical protein F8388_025561, partial [Cannabis sativa]